MPSRLSASFSAKVSATSYDKGTDALSTSVLPLLPWFCAHSSQSPLYLQNDWSLRPEGHLPVNGVDDDRDGQEPKCGGGPFSDSQGPAGHSTQDVERGSTQTVDSEAWDGYRGQRLPHKGVDHSQGHSGAAACFRAWHLVGTKTFNPAGAEAGNL